MHEIKIIKDNTNLNNRSSYTSKSSKSLSWKEWNIWVEKNGKPKYYQRPKNENDINIRFRKSGPMTKTDWDHFQIWSQKNAQPKGFQTVDLGKENITEYKLQTYPQIEKPNLYLNKANPYPIQMNNTPIPEFKSIFTLSGMKYCCLDHDKEAEFWRYLRFPVSKKALNYNVTKRIMNLSKPRTFRIN